MGLDIRYPIGLLFLIFGVVLAGVGITSDPAPAVNINLWWGAVTAAFGAGMFGFALRASRSAMSREP